MTSAPLRANGAVLLLGVGIGCFAAGLLTGVFASRLAQPSATPSSSSTAPIARSASGGSDTATDSDTKQPAPPQPRGTKSEGYGTTRRQSDGRAGPPPSAPGFGSASSASDRDGDGIPDDKDGCPDNKSLQAPRDYYDDSDGDGAGYPKVKQSSCESTPPRGYVDNANDECPKRKDKQKQEQCGCDWPYPDSQDRDGNGINDCIEDDDHDMVPNRDDKDYVPESLAEKSLGDLRDRVRRIADRVQGFDAGSLSCEDFTRSLGGELKDLKKVEDELLKLERKLHADAVKFHAEGKPHGFDRTVFPAACGCKVSRDRRLEASWDTILAAIKDILQQESEAKSQYILQKGGNKEWEGRVNRAFDDARKLGPSKLLDPGVAEAEHNDINKPKGGTP